MVYIPTIDFRDYDEANETVMSQLAGEVTEALTTCGFMKIRNLGIAAGHIDRAFECSRWFFSRDSAEKMHSRYTSAAENFGYQGLCVEYLDPSKPADLKETFTMRDLKRHDPDDPRWPTQTFRDDMTQFYVACLQGAYRIQRVFARALALPSEFFVQYHQGENVTLRLLYYPSTGVSEIKAGQLGAGVHTDYGMITLLFQRNIGGLEVADRDGNWHAVEPENDAIVINTGDLMERWSNGKFRSTPHRVQPKIGSEDRFSIAMFVDPDTETPVKVLSSCLAEDETPRYPEVTAGNYILQRIEASHEAARKVQPPLSERASPSSYTVAEAETGGNLALPLIQRHKVKLLWITAEKQGTG